MMGHEQKVREACVYLSAKHDRLARLIAAFPAPTFDPDRDPYEALVRAIIFQQISGKAAQAIFKRFLQIFENSEFPSPSQLIDAEIESLRKAGLSQRKAEYIQAVARAFTERDFLATDLSRLSDADVSSRLTNIRGVGQWTADMFMMFTLVRMDILPVGDQGIRNGIKKFFNLDHLPDAEEMHELTGTWTPYRTIACWYLWKLVDEDFQW